MNKILIISFDNDTDNITELTQRLGIKFDDKDIMVLSDTENVEKEFNAIDFYLVVLDIDNVGAPIENFVKMLRDIDPFIDIIIYTECKDINVLKNLVNLGIEGYITKGEVDSLENLLDQICKIVSC